MHPKRYENDYLSDGAQLVRYGVLLILVQNWETCTLCFGLELSVLIHVLSGGDCTEILGRPAVTINSAIPVPALEPL